MFGGSDPGAAAMNPADLEFRGNLVSRPLAWRSLYWVRNLFELKNLDRALVEGNIFENNWFSGQKGHALLFTVRNQDGNCPTCTVQDITLRNNIVRNAPTAVSILGTDDLNTSGYTGDLLFTNNLFDNIDYPAFADSGTSHTILITGGPRYVAFERNTFINQANFGGMIAFSGNDPTTGFVFRKNLMRAQQYGVLGDNATPGTGALDMFAPGSKFELNGIAGSSATHPANNQYLSTASWESQFVRYNGGQNGDYRLTSPNAYGSAGIADAGADITAVLAATACTFSGNCAGSSVPPPADALPPDPVPPVSGSVSAAGPWTDQGIGSTGQSGSSGYAGGTFTLRAAGADIWGSSDDFRYVYETLNGDGQIVARVTSIQNTHVYAKAGVMIRGSLNPNAAHAMLDVGPTGGVEWMTRAVTGGETSYLAGTNRPAPVWLRLTRAGSTMTGEVSSDGTTWTLLGSTTVVLGQQVYIGLVVCSHDSGMLNTATFDNVSVTAAPGTGATDIVVRAADLPASAPHGIWSTTSDTTAAGGSKLTTSDSGWSSIDTPLANPANYVDVTFNANAGTPYRVWLRLKARDNTKSNDSVWVQFSDARVNGSPAYPLNSAGGLLVNLATDSGASSLVGWGWENSAYWLNQATTVTFANSGAHTLRIQVREDGVEFDQVVLSPATYLNARPGSVTNDSTVLAP
jgi:regulation of enolase protein 1 (concanavalin A-like superfamily)